ncbi:hypothetical protein DIURU_005225 [Diutina rugosa]|uniref:50S ribosomal protein L35 n=1 Tax=Diutina rugosa TaxID=5481 RepID=A0A642UE83_DIURU|nr:uncharacterized protein DIURU_005225 [Diutina rugosa]KAA8897446.1 hypothetical protein DIURU_005225 [Diutina rugosa]
MLGRLLQTARFVQSPVQMMLMQTRTKMKTHKAAAKRFIKTGTGIKRKQAGRNHGNGGFSANTLHHLDGFVKISNRGQHLKKIGRYL